MTIESESKPTLNEVESKLQALVRERLERTDELINALEHITEQLDKNIGHKFEGSRKTAMWVRMDIMRIVQFHAQLHYDTEITANQIKEVNKEGKKEWVVKYGVVEHTYIAPEDLIEQKLSILDDDDKEVFLKRHQSKAAEKSAELHKKSRDFAHLFEKVPEYERFPEVHTNGDDPVIDYLNKIGEFHEHNWIDEVHVLRGLVFSVNRKEIEKVQLTATEVI